MKPACTAHRAAIVAAVAAGVAQATLAARYRVSRQRVNQIVHADRQRARYAVRDALLSGRLVRPEQCERCGKRCKPQAHHLSYRWEDRLAVLWLCGGPDGCHGAEHRVIARRRHDSPIRGRALRHSRRAA